MRDMDEMKLARVIDACGGVDGRVKMQKIVYLLRMIGYDLPYNDFTIRQLGPFSRAVACDTDLLRSAGVVQETREEISESPGEPVVQYSYAVQETLAPLIRRHFDIDGPAGRPDVDDVAKELKKQDRAVLEVAATKVFLERHDKRSGEALHTELRRLKGHLASRFGEADALIAKMKQEQWL